MGLVSFSLVGLMGMLPVGLSSFREAMEVQTQARIAQEIAAELQLTPFSKITDGTFQGNFPRYYNEEGTPASQGESIYTVKTSSAGSVDLPGGVVNSSMRLLTFGIEKKTAPGASETFSLIASNTGQ